MEEKALGRSESNDSPTNEALGEFSRALLELVSELAPCSEEKLFIAAATRELRGAGNWSLLRLKQEIHNSVRQLTDQGLVKINEQEIFVTELGTEHLAGRGGIDAASEPAMEEVLGSIRKIISDNETGQVDAQTATLDAQAENEVLEGDVDNLTIDDSAFVLTSDDAETPAAHEEEILELTEELGGLEVIEDEDAETPAAHEEEVLELTEELGGLEVIEDEDAGVLEAALEDVENEAAESLEAIKVLELDDVVAEAPRNFEAEKAHPQSPRQVFIRSAEPPPSPSQWASARLERARPRAGQTATSTTPPADSAKSQTPPKSGMETSEPAFGFGPAVEPALNPMAAAPRLSAEAEPEMAPLPAPVAESAPDAPKLSASMEEVELALEHAIASLKAGQSPSTASAPSPAALSVPASADPASPAFGWSDKKAGEQSCPTLGRLVENFPRRMRAHIPVEAEVRVSPSMTDNVPLGLVGSGETVIHEFEVAQAMSLKLSAPNGGFIIESRSPETQWVRRERDGQTNECLASWRFTLTPTRRGSNVLRLTFSYKAIAGGIVADSTLPDKVLDIVVATNFGRTCAKAAAWFLTLILGAALGAYFHPVMQLAGFPG